MQKMQKDYLTLFILVMNNESYEKDLLALKIKLRMRLFPRK
jgi:hypothetical protein